MLSWSVTHLGKGADEEVEVEKEEEDDDDDGSGGSCGFKCRTGDETSDDE